MEARQRGHSCGPWAQAGTWSGLAATTRGRAASRGAGRRQPAGQSPIDIHSLAQRGRAEEAHLTRWQ